MNLLDRLLAYCVIEHADDGSILLTTPSFVIDGSRHGVAQNKLPINTDVRQYILENIIP